MSLGSGKWPEQYKKILSKHVPAILAVHSFVSFVTKKYFLFSAALQFFITKKIFTFTDGLSVLLFLAFLEKIKFVVYLLQFIFSKQSICFLRLLDIFSK